MEVEKFHLTSTEELLALPISDMKKKWDGGRTAVHELACRECLEIISYPDELLSIRDSNGCTPIYYLAFKGVKQISKVSKSILEMKDKNGICAYDFLPCLIKRKQW